MKTFTATDARNRFGEFLDSGMVEGVKVVRNNRILGYFVPEREYEVLKRAASVGVRTPELPDMSLSPEQLETLALFSQGKIASTEAKVELGCDRRGLISLLSERGFLLPHVARSRAEEMARAALEAIGLPTEDQPRDRAARRTTSRG